MPGSFLDPARHQGALYKVTNWTSLGFIKGFHCHRADFYQDLESPKQLWAHPLQKNARALLSIPGELSGAAPCRYCRSRLLLMPGYDAFNDLVNAIDPVSLATCCLIEADTEKISPTAVEGPVAS